MNCVLSGLRNVLYLTVVLFFLFGCSEEAQPPAADKEPREAEQPFEVPREPELISVLPAEAYRLLQEQPNMVVVDVRTQQERAEARIEGSVAVSLTDIMQGSEKLPRDKPLLLVCAVGGRSYGAGLYLLKRGYPLLYNLRGGIQGWYREGLPLVTAKQ